MQLLRHLMLPAACDSFSFSAKHILGISKQVADALSCFHWLEFFQYAPAVQSLIPSQLLQDVMTSL